MTSQRHYDIKYIYPYVNVKVIGFSDEINYTITESQADLPFLYVFLWDTVSSTNVFHTHSAYFRKILLISFFGVLLYYLKRKKTSIASKPLSGGESRERDACALPFVSPFMCPTPPPPNFFETLDLHLPSPLFPKPFHYKITLILK